LRDGSQPTTAQVTAIPNAVGPGTKGPSQAVSRVLGGSRAVIVIGDAKVGVDRDPGRRVVRSMFGRKRAAVILSPHSLDRDLLGQTVLVIGGSSGIGLETARLARAKGADLILTARSPDRLHRVGLQLGASIAAFDATDIDRLQRFFDALHAPVDHVLLACSGPCSARGAESDFESARYAVQRCLLLPFMVASHSAHKVRDEGTLLLIGRHRAEANRSLVAALAAALQAMTQSLSDEAAPVRVNLIELGFIDTPVPAQYRRTGVAQRRSIVSGPVDVASLAIQLMTTTKITGASLYIGESHRPSQVMGIRGDPADPQ
jgi:NAD(P)-dependent dehydrogenase (short-subunit alcohol dehydrogenase family)